MLSCSFCNSLCRSSICASRCWICFVALSILAIASTLPLVASACSFASNLSLSDLSPSVISTSGSSSWYSSSSSSSSMRSSSPEVDPSSLSVLASFSSHWSSSFLLSPGSSFFSFFSGFSLPGWQCPFRRTVEVHWWTHMKTVRTCDFNGLRMDRVRFSTPASFHEKNSQNVSSWTLSWVLENQSDKIFELLQCWVFLPVQVTNRMNNNKQYKY